MQKKHYIEGRLYYTKKELYIKKYIQRRYNIKRLYKKKLYRKKTR